MKVIGLDGRTHVWSLAGHSPKESDTEGRSSGHLRARALLARLYPVDRRLEELTLPGADGLRLDFYLPGRRLAVEVQGRQHDEYVGYFHKHRLGFVQSQGRDVRKSRWCELNGIRLVELPDGESDDEWADRLLGRATEAD
jgi:hypothetical protein